MIHRWTSNRLARKCLWRGAACGLTAAFCVGLVVASSSLAMSFEPSEQAPVEQPAKPDAGKAGSPATKAGSPSEKHKPQAKGARDQAHTGENAGGAGRTKMPVPERPVRTVTTPSWTSADLDRVIAAHLAKNSPKVEPATLTTDVEFVRRIYFDVAGKPPTPDQVQSFVRDRDKDKRARLIDRLLDSPEYARNWAKYWRDVIMFHATNENLAACGSTRSKTGWRNGFRPTRRGTRSSRG